MTTGDGVRSIFIWSLKIWPFYRSSTHKGRQLLLGADHNLRAIEARLHTYESFRWISNSNLKQTNIQVNKARLIRHVECVAAASFCIIISSMAFSSIFILLLWNLSLPTCGDGRQLGVWQQNIIMSTEMNLYYLLEWVSSVILYNYVYVCVFLNWCWGWLCCKLR